MKRGSFARLSVRNWVPDPSTDDPGYTFEVTGLDDSQMVWSYTYVWTYDQFGNYILVNAFQQVTNGAGLPIDELSFNDMQDAAIDDVTISAVPEPTSLLIVGASALPYILLRRRERR